MFAAGLLITTFISPFILHNIKCNIKAKQLFNRSNKHNTLRAYEGCFEYTDVNNIGTKNNGISILEIYNAKRGGCSSSSSSNSDSNSSSNSGHCSCVTVEDCLKGDITISKLKNDYPQIFDTKIVMCKKLTKFKIDADLNFVYDSTDKNGFIYKILGSNDTTKLKILPKKESIFTKILYKKIEPSNKEYIIDTYASPDATYLKRIISNHIDLYYTESVIPINERVYMLSNPKSQVYVVSYDYNVMLDFISSRYYYKISLKYLIIIFIIVSYLAQGIYQSNREFFDGVDVCDEFYKRED